MSTLLPESAQRGTWWRRVRPVLEYFGIVDSEEPRPAGAPDWSHVLYAAMIPLWASGFRGVSTLLFAALGLPAALVELLRVWPGWQAPERLALVVLVLEAAAVTALGVLLLLGAHVGQVVALASAFAVLTTAYVVLVVAGWLLHRHESRAAISR